MSDMDNLSAEFEDCANTSALYAAGALPAGEARQFEQRLASGCPLCTALADSYVFVAEFLACAHHPVTPPPSVKERLLRRIQPEAIPDYTTVVRGSDSPWIKLPYPGVEMRSLIGNSTVLIRMKPGAVFPAHYHPKAEQCFVLEGTVTDSDGIVLRTGDFSVVKSGMKHEPIHTETGCILFIAYAD